MIYKARDVEKGYAVEIEVIDDIVAILVFDEDDWQQGGLVKIKKSDWDNILKAIKVNECKTQM